MESALYVGVKKDNYNWLCTSGYIRALQKWGWKVTWLKHSEVSSISSYDLIVWSGGIPEHFLKSASKQQCIIALGGAGEDIDYYRRYADCISLLATSFWSLDEPWTVWCRYHLSRRSLSWNTRWTVHFHRRFRRYSSPKFWRATGIRFIYLPFASDVELFSPQRRNPDLDWCFVGSLRQRGFIRHLIAASDERGWRYELFTPTNPIDPQALNGLYNRVRIGINEQTLMTFGRELNERTFDLGMAGLTQISDMGYLAAQEISPYGKFYAGKLAGGDDYEYGVHLVEQALSQDLPDREVIHAHFRARHSFEARLALMSAAMGMDLSRGRMKLQTNTSTFEGEHFAPLHTFSFQTSAGQGPS